MELVAVLLVVTVCLLIIAANLDIPHRQILSAFLVVAVAGHLLIVTTDLDVLTRRLLSSSPSPPVGGTKYPYPFMTGDAEKASSRTYDYVIVGGGTAGCPLAATLSQNYSVLVLERGDSPYGNPEIEEAKYFTKPLNESDEYYSVAQTFVTKDGVNGARGRVLGGSSCLNAGFYSRASAGFIQQMGWHEALVVESYEWVERAVAFWPDPLALWQSGVKQGLVEIGVLPYNGYTLDHLRGTKTGASTFDNNGKRHTSADHLKRANADNIVVLLNATAKRILFNSSPSGTPRAMGVEFVNKENTKSYNVSVKENGEVILCAGAIGSPQLLLLSGIGPSKQLKDFHTPVIVDLPGVGQDIADNPRTDVYMLSKIPFNFSAPQVVGIVNPTPWSTNYIDAVGPVRKPNIYIEALSVPRNVQNTTVAYIGWILQKLGGPLSRGELWLQSLDPRDNPSLRYNYYSEARDLNECIQGAKILAALNQSNPLHRFAYENASDIPHDLLPVLETFGPPFPEDTSNDTAMGNFCRQSLATIWHYHGGCNIGSVIDDKYNVIGVDGLRVVDASTFNSTPGTNPQATIEMLGRYKGVQILEERGQSAMSYHSNI